MPEVPTLETERVVLRGWTADDFPDFASVFSDADHCRYIGGACSEDDAWRRLAMTIGHWSLRGFGPWAVTSKGDGRLLGSVGLWQPGAWPDIEIAYWLNRRAVGQGYATEACRAARQFAYADLGLDALVSFIHPENRASQAVAIRLGARIEATIELKGVECDRWRHPPGSDT